ncbi:MAG: epoxyqueuosine reductase [bacterium]
MSAKEEIRQFLKNYQVRIIGFGETPDTITKFEITEDYPRVIVFGYQISKAVLSTIKDRPTLIYKQHYKTVNWLLDQTAYHLVQFIVDKGFNAIAIPASQTVDWQNQKGHISHKLLALASGLGYIGRSGLLINPQFGAQVRYVSVLTDLEFEPDKKISGDCGNCKKCIVACPAGAISETGVDLKKCLEKLKTFARIPGIGQYICGVCVKVCNGRN